VIFRGPGTPWADMHTVVCHRDPTQPFSKIKTISCIESSGSISFIFFALCKPNLIWSSYHRNLNSHKNLLLAALSFFLTPSVYVLGPKKERKGWISSLENTLNHLTPKRLSRKVARLLIVADPQWVQNDVDVCGLHLLCILVLTSSSRQVPVTSTERSARQSGASQARHCRSRAEPSRLWTGCPSSNAPFL